MAAPVLDRDLRLRLAAFARLADLTRAGGGVITSAALDQGFEFEGARIPLWNERRGIWRPRQLGDGAALTIVTTPPRPGKQQPYDDQIASDDEWFVYRYEGTAPNTWTNVAVRRAHELRRPLIYLYGVTPGTYVALFPCYVERDDPASLSFHISTAAAGDIARSALAPELDAAAPLRAYATRTAKVRLHQRRFRELVVAAYRERCAVCRLAHPELLDAAHILADRDERGRPEVPNGLSLCKIHHGAFDAHMLGISPDYRVHIRLDVLEEEDGPMLEHGLQAMDGSRITLPRAERHRPNRDFLAERYERFRAA
jgi:putative restriction endonuclease